MIAEFVKIFQTLGQQMGSIVLVFATVFYILRWKNTQDEKQTEYLRQREESIMKQAREREEAFMRALESHRKVLEEMTLALREYHQSDMTAHNYQRDEHRNLKELVENVREISQRILIHGD